MLADMHINPDFINWNLRVSQQKFEDPIKKVIQNALAASCTVYGSMGQEQWTGSGFHIGGGYIATAAHVAPPEAMSQPSKMSVSFDGQTLIPATIVASDPDNDCALIRAESINFVSNVMLGDSDAAEVGDIIAVIGAPEGWHDTANVGRITNIHQSLGEQSPSPAWNDLIFIDAHILQGVSGGMVIGTDGLAYGLVMGVTGINAQVGVGENAVCPINKLRHLIAEYQNNQQNS